MKAIFFGFLLICLTGIISCSTIITDEDYYFKASDYYLVDDYGGALKYLDSCLKLNPKNVKAFTMRGFSNYHLKKYKESIIDYSNAISFDSSDYMTFFWRGRAKQESMDHLGAEIDFKKAITLNPNEKWAYNNIGVVRYKYEEYIIALEYFLKSH